jgi:hypothetical protein
MPESLLSHFARLFALSLALVLLLLVLPASARPATNPPAGVQGLVVDDGGLHFSLHVPAYELDGSGLLSAPGLDSRGTTAGAPAVPYFSTLVALPPGAAVAVTARAEAVAVHTLARPLQASPRPDPGVRDGLDSAAGLASLSPPLAGLSSPDPELYGRDALFPERLYDLSEPMYFRDLRVVRLDLYPLRYNPARGLLEHSPQLDVRLDFAGARFDNLQPAPTAGDSYVATLAGALLNPEQAAGWRSLPAAPAIPGPALPTGQDSYRIEVLEDGIYELTYEQLRDAGMAVDSVNPNTFAMMNRGEPVAYQFAGDGDDRFEPGEAIRFYGWAFDGTRHEEQYVTANVFWLWPGGTPARIGTLPASDAAETAATFRAEVTHAPKRQYTTTGLDEEAWAAFPNEPDTWYWEWFSRSNVDTDTHDIIRSITLPHPAADGTATLTVELFSAASASPYGDIMVSMGPGFTHAVTTTWSSPRSDNVELHLPASALQDGENPVRLTFFNPQVNRTTYYLNRFTVSYPRLFIADDDQLIFDGDPAGPRRYTIANFSQGDPALVWEIGNRLQPQAVPAVEVIGAGGAYDYSFSTDATGTRFIAASHAAVRTPASISRYDAPSLDPEGGAGWLAITDPDFAAPLQTLAAHRADTRFGGLQTAVVSVDDVVNQYGHGLPLPDAIRDYLTHALFTWPFAPQYVLLAGDATVNPHHATCDGPNEAYTLCGYWSDGAELNHVPTHLLFKDRFQGHVPSDYPNVLLAGDDPLPDLAIGRLAVQTAQEAANVVAKIIAYETGHLEPGPVQTSLVFLSDNADGGGNFPAASLEIAALIPAGYAITMVDQLNSTPAAVSAARTAARDAIHPPNGATVLNYRGHGSVFNWGDNLFNANDPNLWPWPNSEPWVGGEPLVILSLDCLDGNFIYPGQPALSETFHALAGTGSVAHWSSTGLGYTYEHQKLHENFYRAIFDHGILPIGDAINYTKVQYAALMSGGAYHESELWTFTLQGDPAMRMWRLDLETDEPAPISTFLPLLSKP